MKATQDELILRVQDSGPGFNAEQTFVKSEPLGMKFIRLLSSNLDATERWENSNGTLAIISLPM